MVRPLQAAAAASILLATIALAKPPVQNPALAEKLHKEAVEAGKRGKWEQAVERWVAAEAVHAHWKYAFNLASSLAHLQRWLPAWHASQRARRLGVPEEHLVTLEAIEERVTTELAVTHAWIEIRIEPPDARISRDGVPWPEAGGVWVPAGRDAKVEVSRKGYRPQRFELVAAAGTRVKRTVTLQALPTVAPPPEVAPFGAPMVHATAAPRLRIWKWTSLGVGGALVALGGGLLGWSAAQASSWESDSGSYEQWSTYSPAYDEAQARFDRTRIAGWVTIGVGGAMLATSVVLFVLDRGSGPGTNRGVSVTPAVLPGGAALQGALRF